MNFFCENYDFIVKRICSIGKKVYIGDRNNLTCRFCGRDKSTTTFKNNSHAIPECLGNKQVILLEECDECNRCFSNNLEDHLDKYTKPYRTLSQIKGKSKIPSYKSKDQKSRIDIKDRVEIKTPTGQVMFQEGNNSFELLLEVIPKPVDK